MKRLAALCLAALALAAPSLAQNKTCSNLAITTVVDDVRPYQKVTIAIEKSLADAPVYLTVGSELGKTTINLRALGAFDLDLARPFTTYLLGVTDDEGNLSRTVTVPIERGLTLNAQAVGLKLERNSGGKPMATFCVSNTATFEL